MWASNPHSDVASPSASLICAVHTVNGSPWGCATTSRGTRSCQERCSLSLIDRIGGACRTWWTRSAFSSSAKANRPAASRRIRIRAAS